MNEHTRETQPGAVCAAFVPRLPLRPRTQFPGIVGAAPVPYGVLGLWRWFNGLHGIGFGRRPLQWRTQAHLVRAIPECGAGVQLDNQ